MPPRLNDPSDSVEQISALRGFVTVAMSASASLLALLLAEVGYHGYFVLYIRTICEYAPMLKIITMSNSLFSLTSLMAAWCWEWDMLTRKPIASLHNI